MSWIRKTSVLGLVLLLGLGCTSDQLGPSENPQPAPVEQPSELLWGLGGGDDGQSFLGGLLETVGVLVIRPVVEVTDLLTCSSQPYAVTTKRIGREGGVIEVGEHRLVIPRNALRKSVLITAEQMPGSSNSVRFSPHGTDFEKPAVLTMSYSNCSLVLLPKRIIYTTESLGLIKAILSFDLFRSKKVSAPIDHFSRYAVAY